MAEFTKHIPDAVAKLEDLAGLLEFWNEEICKKEMKGKSFIFSVVLGTEGDDAGRNLVWFKDTNTEPKAPSKLQEFPITLSDEDRRKAVLDFESANKLEVRSSAIVLLGGEKKWVALFDPAAVPAGGPGPVAPAPGDGNFSTKPGDAHDNSGNVAHTDGLRGTRVQHPDGTIVIDATERISAHYDGNNFGPAIARQVRTTKGKTTVVQQREGYCWRQRDLQDATLIEAHDGFGSTAHETGRATRFGKNDNQDSGASTPTYKIVQTCSEVFGVSLKAARMAAALGPNWTTDPRRLTAMVEIYNSTSKRFAKVPLVEVGPGSPDAVIDLTWALDAFLQTSGGAQVDFRLVI